MLRCNQQLGTINFTVTENRVLKKRGNRWTDTSRKTLIN